MLRKLQVFGGGKLSLENILPLKADCYFNILKRGLLYQTKKLIYNWRSQADMNTLVLVHPNRGGAITANCGVFIEAQLADKKTHKRNWKFEWSNRNTDNCEGNLKESHLKAQISLRNQRSREGVRGGDLREPVTYTGAPAAYLSLWFSESFCGSLFSFTVCSTLICKCKRSLRVVTDVLNWMTHKWSASMIGWYNWKKALKIWTFQLLFQIFRLFTVLPLFAHTVLYCPLILSGRWLQHALTENPRMCSYFHLLSKSATKLPIRTHAMDRLRFLTISCYFKLCFDDLLGMSTWMHSSCW